MKTFLFTLAGVLGLTVVPLRNAYSDTAIPLTTLGPGGWFRIPRVEGFTQPGGLRARGGYLYILLQKDDVFWGDARSVILKTDLRGEVVSSLTFPGRLQELRVDPSGQIAARYPSNGGFTAVVWDANLNAVSTFQRPPAADAFGFHRGELVSLRDSIVEPVDPSSTRPGITLVRQLGAVLPLDVSFVPLSKNRTLVIGGVDASVSVIEGDAVARRVLLEDPVIERSPQDDPESGYTWVFSAASDEQERAYVGITGFKGWDGPTVVQLDRDARTLHRYRCAPPARPEFEESGPYEIAITGTTLFVSFSKMHESAVAWYSLSN